MVAGNKIVKFSVDTKHRKQWFTGLSFSHPAKMALPLQLWLIENFTKEGETILDPMAGSGTLLVACSLGRNVICVELESKFVDMMKGNWEKIQQRGPQMGYSMGNALILQGDARNLTGILVENIISSPPFGDAIGRSSSYYDKIDTKNKERIVEMAKWYGDMSRYSDTEGQIGNLPYGNIDKIITSPPYAETFSVHAGGNMRLTELGRKTTDLSAEEREEAKELAIYSRGEDNISNLPYGEIDTILTSPPYAEVIGGGSDREIQIARGRNPDSPGASPKPIDSPSNISNLPYGEIDKIITSPPYEESLKHPVEDREREFKKLRALGFKINPNSADNKVMGDRYSGSASNIGNLKSASYLEAMLVVYHQCYVVLKPGGLMVLVTKNFIRNKTIVRLDSDTISLCETAGFILQDRWYRQLTSQSFWRTIYARRYPTAPTIDYEDILVFRKN